MRAIALGLEFCARRATILLALGVLIGLALPPLAQFMRPVLAPVIFLNLVVAMLRLEGGEVARFVRRPALSGACLLAVLGISPLLVWAVAGPLGLPAGLLAGLVLMAAAPPITSAPAFALILGLDAAFALFITLIGHVLVPFTLPLVALWLLDLELNISLLEFMGRLALLVAGCFALTFVLKRWVLSPAVLRRNAARLDGLAVVGLVIFAIAIMDGVAATALERPGFVALVIAAAFIANAALQVAGALAFWLAGRRLALTAGHMIGNCNMGLVLAVLADRAGADVVLFFALAQLPMYMLPSLALPIYRRLLAR